MRFKLDWLFDPRGGWQRVKDEWERREALLETLSEDLMHYASAHQMHVEKGRKGHVRSLVWKNRASATYKLEISLPTEGAMDLCIRIMAWQDRRIDSKWARYLKHEIVAEQVTLEELKDGLVPLLEEGRMKMGTWTDLDLAFTTWLPESR